MQTLGIHLDPPFCKIAKIQKSRRGITILALDSCSIDQPANVKRLYIDSFRGKVCSGLSAKDLLIRSLEVPMKKHRHMEEVIAFQNETLGHFDPAEILSVPYFSSKKKGETLLFSASRHALRTHLETWKRLGFDPDVVSANALGLVHFARWKFPSLTDAFFIDLGSSEWTCVWMHQGVLKRSHIIEGGIEALLLALREDRKTVLLPKEVEGFAKQVDVLSDKLSYLYPRFASRLEEMQKELAKICFLFHRSAGSRPAFFTGKVHAFGSFCESLRRTIQDSISEENLSASPSEESSYAISIGLAMEPARDVALQMRREEFFPQKHWARAGMFAIGLFFLSCSFSLLMGAFGYWTVQVRKKEMIDSLTESLEKWDGSWKEEFFSKARPDEEILDLWSRSVSSYAKEFPYLPRSPKVAEVLPWLYNLPALASMRNSGNGFDLLSFRYILEQFPTLDRPKEPYLAKVEMEFNIADPIDARKFHEALLQDVDWVSSERELQWEPLHDSYRASFYLKNRSF